MMLVIGNVGGGNFEGDNFCGEASARPLLCRDATMASHGSLFEAQ